MNGKWKEEIKNYYRNHRLSKNQLRQLQNTLEDSQGNIYESYFRKPLTLALATVMLIIGAVVWITQNSTGEISELVAEIAYHHNKKLAVEFKSTTLEELKSHLSKLDFPLIRPQGIPWDEWTLIGGRYCSIRGKLGAELRIRNKVTNEIHTLYQLANVTGIKSFSGFYEIFENGVKVRVWQEHGLLLVTASDAG